MIHENEKEILSILSEDETGIKEQRIFLKRKKKQIQYKTIFPIATLNINQLNFQVKDKTSWMYYKQTKTPQDIMTIKNKP